MRFYIKIPGELKKHYQLELLQAEKALASGHLQLSWRHLERAHILGQSFPFEHTHAHWKMLQFGFHIKSAQEVWGQILRLLVGGVKSFVGNVLLGNTGGANVPPLQPMEIPEDLQPILMKYLA